MCKSYYYYKVTDLLKAIKAQKSAKWYYPSKEEKAILKTLFAFDVTPPDATINSVLEILLTYWDGWTKKKIRDVWNYEKRKGKQAEDKIQE
ncbi:9991_t:CDS:2 [Funneliformis mosseae]|uniref:9991_t:CDS:1 n=1 Tax=Funneliformis mosseae TaxID=27381 RepID=A0A9N8V244_FUNMO|nr:9991_t:CDS:2 [Funneliformis mosseae]